MIVVGNKGNMVKTTPPGVVAPFYVYAAIAFLAGSSLLLLTPPGVHYFSPLTLAVTHTMSLGWGTMIILGASHHLVHAVPYDKWQRLKSHSQNQGSYPSEKMVKPTLPAKALLFPTGKNQMPGLVPTGGSRTLDLLTITTIPIILQAWPRVLPAPE